MISPGTFISRKGILPSELRTKDWRNARVQAQLLERSFVMAGTVKYEALEANRRAAAALADGEMSLVESRRYVRQALREQQYQPAPGQAGTIKDLTSIHRQNITLQTNADMARGYADYQRMVGNIDYPAQELYRNRSARDPRKWEKVIWPAAASSVGYAGVAATGMIALTDSPIWLALSDFGNPYPPYKFGSGMWTRPVKYRVARDMGLLTPADEARIQTQLPVSFNDQAEASPGITDPEWRNELARQLEGIAEWRDDTLVMIDRNGSRPYEADEIGGIITRRTPDYYPETISHNYQEEALKEFLDDPEGFASGYGAEERRVNLDMIQDAEMLFTRILLEEDVPALEAEIDLDEDGWRQISGSGLYTIPRTRLALMAAPAGSPSMITGRNTKFIIESSLSARRIDAAAQAIGTRVAPGSRVLLGGTSYKVNRMTEGEDQLTVYLEELP